MSPNFCHRSSVPPNSTSMNRNRMYGNSNSRSYNLTERPPERPPVRRLNFIVELHPDAGVASSVKDIEALIKDCSLSPDTYAVKEKESGPSRLFFRQWSTALKTMASLWEKRFDRGEDGGFSPFLIPKVIVSSDAEELQSRLKSVFVGRIRGFIDGEAVVRLEDRVDSVESEIVSVSATLRRPHKIWEFEELQRKKEGLVREKNLILKRLAEFKAGLRCILDHLGVEDDVVGDEFMNVRVFAFEEGKFNWERIFQRILRELRRLDQSLPIYAYRREILSQITSQQVMVLIGETGSGKSTQLVQFLIDAGVSGHGSVVCTQPRKIAALSLADRVRDESSGCYGENAISCCSSYSSSQRFNAEAIYMTDHCLLQHCMNGKSLSEVSCIVIDEAHERSLNTDLLLALIKTLLCDRFDLRLVIMSATADADQLSEYFFGCGTFKVVGRNFPVDVKYVPTVPVGLSVCSEASSSIIAPYVSSVLRMATEIHGKEKEGAILAFLTSQMEVEWACERFQMPGSVALPLHGKLSSEEQSHVFQNYSGKRKVIFATNVAETSLTIPGVKYVIDSGMVKESRYEAGSGMNVLRVSWVSKSSAKQRAGRAGRTEPGQCYRLYTQDEFELFPAQQEPEIRRVHLGVAVLKILALGMTDVNNFDFVDAPSAQAIDMAIRNLVQLGAVTMRGDVIELAGEGRALVKLGIEPRLGKLILSCIREGLGKEGIVLAALMANSSSIFCRVGNDAEKFKSDRLKVPFCHRDGDLFTLLSVYKKWEGLPFVMRSKWCWENSINAKTMRRCYDAISELENCLQTELRRIIPSYWRWIPDVVTEHDRNLKKAILAALSENVACYSGCDELGYEVALTGQHIQLHPSCSLLMFSQKPDWVVFGDILSASNEYLLCVTAFDAEFLFNLYPTPPFDVLKVENRKLRTQILSGFGTTLLKRFCGKFQASLSCLLSHVRTICGDDRIGIQVNVDNNEIRVYAALHDMEMVLDHVNNVLEHEKKLLMNECMEKYLYKGGAGVNPPVALFGAGAEIRHLELDRRCLTVDVHHSDASNIDDKELLMLIENHASGVCAFRKSAGHSAESEEKPRWGSVTFLSPDAAQKALKLNNVEFHGSMLKTSLCWTNIGADRSFSFPAVNARVYWPRRISKGFGFVTCEIRDICFMVDDFSKMRLGERSVRCVPSTTNPDSIMIRGIDTGLSETEILDALRAATSCRILDFFLVRGDVVDNPACNLCEEALSREISSFMPKGNPLSNYCRVQVFQPLPKDVNMKAMITFDGRMHLEAAKALEQMEGKVLPLPGFQPWQKIQCQRLFHSSVSCPSSVYNVIRCQLDSLLARYKHRKGVECDLVKNNNYSFRVKLSANATKTVAELRRPLEMLMKGTAITDPSLNPAVLQHLFFKDGITLMRAIQQETDTCILFDRHALNVKIFGLPEKITSAEQKLVHRLLDLHENKKMAIHLRGDKWPPDSMKSVLSTFGPDLNGLKEKVPEAEFILNTRRHVLSISGGNKETKKKVEEIIYEVAASGNHDPLGETSEGEAICPICLCEVEDKYSLESCMHVFCSQCLVDQCESALRSKDCFPIRCSREGCGAPILLIDLKALLPNEKMDELFRASLGSFVASSGGAYRFCPSPDCSSVYKVASSEAPGEPFMCGSCFTETCTKCHVEIHPYMSCEKYKELKEDPDSSLMEWCGGRDNVKRCPVCGFIIEKLEGCNHIECRCDRHICWVCLEHFGSSDDCYNHLRAVHQGIT